LVFLCIFIIKNDLTDLELLRGCLESNAKAQKVFFERYAPKMFGVCLRYASCKEEAEDMLQDGFVRVFNNLSSYRNEGSLEGWVRRIIVHVAIRHKQNQKLQFKEHTYLENTTDVAASPEILSQLNQHEMLGLVQTLPEGYRMIFNLHAIEGYSHSEIAQLLNIQESTSRSQLTKARKWLLQKIHDYYKVEI